MRIAHTSLVARIRFAAHRLARGIARLVTRDRPGRVRTRFRLSHTARAGRRLLLRRLACLPALGVSVPMARSCAADEVTPSIAASDPIIITASDAREYRRLQQLDLRTPAAKEQQRTMPCGKIADLTLGRLISGSNLISMNMHARDLHYVTGLARAYNTQERVFMTLKTCEEQGANSIVLKDHNFEQFHLARYWSEWGGNMLWHADVITTDIGQFERCVARHLDLGASTVYLWGGASDIWYDQGKQENIVKAYEIMRAFGVPVGIGAHRLEPIAFCEREGLVPDYYIKTLHHDRYWSAHSPDKRRFMEMFEPNSPHHDQYHDNMFCHDHQDTIYFMQGVKVPWIAFKVLAAGAIPPEEGIQFAFDSGADFICLGMFDYQVAQDADLVRKCVEKAQNRTRPWA
ncbi:MAG: hypothetical protein ACYC6N_29360 [Pirellulaceae bacterium]